MQVSITITNRGKASGKEAVQVYVTAPDGHIEKPAHELKAFAKTRELKPGESQVLTMSIPLRLLTVYDEAASQWLAEAGTYTFAIGASSRDIRATQTLKLSEYKEPTCDVMHPQVKLSLLKRNQTK